MALFLTANLGRGVEDPEFLANVRALDDEAGPGALIGLQEIDEADKPNEHAGIRRVLGDDYRFAGRPTRVPIAFGEKWHRTSEGVIGASTGLLGLSPHRVITELVSRHARKGLPPLVALNTHFPRNHPSLLSRWRQVEWRLEKRIDHWHARGYTVVWMGDANRARLPKLHPAERTLAHDRLDWIRCVEHPRGLQIDVVDTGSIPLTIDGHDGLWARVRLRPPKEKS